MNDGGIFLFVRSIRGEEAVYYVQCRTREERKRGERREKLLAGRDGGEITPTRRAAPNAEQSCGAGAPSTVETKVCKYQPRESYLYMGGSLEDL